MERHETYTGHCRPVRQDHARFRQTTGDVRHAGGADSGRLEDSKHRARVRTARAKREDGRGGQNDWRWVRRAEQRVAGTPLERRLGGLPIRRRFA